MIIQILITLISAENIRHYQSRISSCIFCRAQIIIYFFFLALGRCWAAHQPIRLNFKSTTRACNPDRTSRSSSEFQGEYPDGLSRLCSDGVETIFEILEFLSRVEWLTGLLNFEISSRVEFKERLLSHIFRGTLSPKLIESWCNQKN